METTLRRIDAYKTALDQKRPFEPPMLEQLQAYYRIGLTYSSNALEGNTLTISETKVVLEDGLTVGGKPLRDIYEAVGHGAAYDYMFTLLHQDRISLDNIKELHRLFYHAIDEAEAGQYRGHDVIVTGTDYVFPTPEELPGEMGRLGEWMDAARGTMHPVEYAALLHLKFVSIHPFADGNGRTARLLMNLALIQQGYQMAVVPPVLRPEYLAAIRRYQNKGDAAKFCELVSEQVYESEKEILRLLHIPFPGPDRGSAIEP